MEFEAAPELGGFHFRGTSLELSAVRAPSGSGLAVQTLRTNRLDEPWPMPLCPPQRRCRNTRGRAARSGGNRHDPAIGAGLLARPKSALSADRVFFLHHAATFPAPRFAASPLATLCAAVEAAGAVKRLSAQLSSASWS